MVTPNRPPTISPEQWRMLPPEDQNELANEYWGPGTAPVIGGYATPAPPPATPEPPRVPASTKAGEVTWAYVRSLNSFPGNHPYFDADRAAGIGGYFLEAHDPYLAFGAAACRAAGFRVGVWSDPHGASAGAYAADLVSAAHSVDADAIAPDPESTGKGSPGSPGWQWNADAAAAIRALDAHITIIVTPTPDQDDFNYGAWTGADSLVWVQLYGEKLTDLYNADEVINRLKANGVPASRIGALIPAGAIAQYIAELQKLGVLHWAIYTIDDTSEADRSVPFGPPEDAQPEPSQAPPDDPSVELDELPDDYALDDDLAYGLADEPDDSDPDDPPNSLGDTSAALAPLIIASGDRTLAGVRRLAPSPLRGVKPPGTVTDAIKRDLLLRKVPSNIAAGIRMALLIVEKGVPYVWGGTDPNRGLDCSGFVVVTFRAAGNRKIARVTYDQAKQGRAVAPGHRQPLDLVFFHRDSRGPGHVGIYMAAGWAVHEPHTGEVAQWLNLATYPALFTRRYFPDVKGTYSAEQNVPQDSPAPQKVNLDTVDSHWHTLMLALDRDRHASAARVRSIGNELAGIVK